MQWSDWASLAPDQSGFLWLPLIDHTSEIIQIRYKEQDKEKTLLLAEASLNGGTCGCCSAFPILDENTQWRKLKVT